MTIDHGQINTRERALSSDWNRQVELGNRGIVESLSAAASASARESGVFGDGFLVTPLNGTMKSAIAPGLALYYDSTKVFPLSTMVWCESREVREVTHAAADPGLPRWDVVEMRPGSAVASTQPRDQFDPLTGTFTVVNMVKEVKSYPEFQIRSGTASPSPGVPAGVAGWIPLAYVLIPAAAVAVDNTKIVYCRPILSTRGIDREGWTTTVLGVQYARNVKGGGLEFGGGNLNGTLTKSVTGRFGQTARGSYHHNFRVDATTPVKVTPMTWDGGGLPAADQVVYFYAIPPPYPAGYDTSLAGRELWTPAPANLYTNGFYDSTLQNGCLIIASSKAPFLTHQAGFVAGSGSFAHEFFAEVGSATSNGQEWVYLGAGSYVLATDQILLQRCDGHTVSPQVKPGKSFLADLPIAAPTLYNVWSFFNATHVQWPVTARDMDLQLRVRIDASDNFKIHLSDYFGDDSVTMGTYANQFSNNDAAEQTFGDIIPVTTDEDGNVTIIAASSTGIGILADVIGKCYRDAVLKIR